MSLPNHSSPTTPRPATLAQAVAQVRHPRNHATSQLEPHREELLRLAQAGDSAETLATGLGLIGIQIGRETMRRWLQQELGRRPAKRRKARTTAVPSASASATTPAITTATAETPITPQPEAPVALPSFAPVRPSGLVLPGETPFQALQRRLAALKARDEAAKAAQSEERTGSPGKDESMTPS